MPNNEPPAAKMVREAIAAEVRGELAKQSKSQRDLGEVLGLPQSAISLRLKGDRPFRAEELALLAQWLGVPADRFTQPAVAVTA